MIRFATFIALVHADVVLYCELHVECTSRVQEQYTLGIRLSRRYICIILILCMSLYLLKNECDGKFCESKVKK